METRVVNIRDAQPYHVYIGKANKYWYLKESIWRNPFSRGTKKENIEKYEEHIRHKLENQEWTAELEMLKGKTLACWCKPKACHGDVLVRLIQEYFPN